MIGPPSQPEDHPQGAEQHPRDLSPRRLHGREPHPPVRIAVLHTYLGWTPADTSKQLLMFGVPLLLGAKVDVRHDLSH